MLPDPKEKLPLFELMNAAKRLAQDENQLEAAIAKMREVLKRDPKIMDAQITLGNWLLRLRRPTRRSPPSSRRSRSSPTTTSRSATSRAC